MVRKGFTHVMQEFMFCSAADRASQLSADFQT